MKKNGEINHSNDENKNYIGLFYGKQKKLVISGVFSTNDLQKIDDFIKKEVI
ncbi:MAG: hypothetical protein KGY67_00655 [Candidatus Thermoplasmatota archaeon]|nr:hypothetical protein [Candidatus Thermoplasmatota archaeon]